jgi:hypothetical protein
MLLPVLLKKYNSEFLYFCYYFPTGVLYGRFKKQQGNMLNRSHEMLKRMIVILHCVTVVVSAGCVRYQPSPGFIPAGQVSSSCDDTFARIHSVLADESITAVQSNKSTWFIETDYIKGSGTVLATSSITNYSDGNARVPVKSVVPVFSYSIRLKAVSEALCKVNISAHLKDDYDYKYVRAREYWLYEKIEKK